MSEYKINGVVQIRCAATQWNWPPECLETGEGSRQPEDVLSCHFVAKMYWCQRQRSLKCQKKLLVLLLVAFENLSLQGCQHI